MAIYSAYDRETLSDVSSSTGLTAAKLLPTNGVFMYALVQAVGGTIRYTVDGTTPTASLGHRLTKDSTVEIWGSEDAKRFRCIDDGGTATPEITYFGAGIE